MGGKAIFFFFNIVVHLSSSRHAARDYEPSRNNLNKRSTETRLLYRNSRIKHMGAGSPFLARARCS